MQFLTNLSKASALNANTQRVLLNAVPGVLILLAASPAVARDPAFIEHTPTGVVVARDADGAKLWEISQPMKGRFDTVERDGSGRIVLDGEYIVSAQGRLRAIDSEYSGVSENRSKTQSGFEYSVPVEISGGPPYNEFQAATPLIDSGGTAWVVMYGNDSQSANSTIQAAQSLDRSGSWAPAETLYTSVDFIVPPAVVMDSAGRITAAFRELSGGMNHIRILRYEPETGWSGLQTIYSTPDFFQQVDAAVDVHGNVVVSFDPGGSSMASLIYNSTTDTWSDVVPVSPPTAGNIEFATLIQNRTRTHVYAVYWETDGAAKGVYLRRFVSPQFGWLPPRRVPGSTNAGFPGSTGPASFIPATVDDSGNVTVASYIQIPIAPFDSIWIMLAARIEGGVWRPPQLVTIHLDRAPELVNYGATDYGANGDVLIVFPRTDESDFVTRFTALHYEAGLGIWNAPNQFAEIGNSLTNVAFRIDGTALATFTSLTWLYDSGTWSSDPIEIPDDPGGFSQRIAVAGLDAILVFSFGDFSPPDDIYATWFTDTAAISRNSTRR